MSRQSQVDVLIFALLEAANDKDQDVQHAVTNSLHTLGAKKPELMLVISHQYLKKHDKISRAHRTIVLKAMAGVCKDKCLETVDPLVVKNIINLCIEEMTATKEVLPDWQNAACSVLVALGHAFCFDVMGCLHLKFQPGVIPHYFIVQALGDLAVANAFGMVPFMKTILQTTLTVLGLVKHDNMKWVFAHVLAQFSEAIMEYVINIEKAPDQSVKKEVFSTELSVAFSTLSTSWLQSKDIKLKTVVVEAIGNISQLLSKEKLEEELPRLIPVILAMYRRHPEPWLITQSLSKILETAVTNNCAAIELQFDSILNTLFPQISSIPDYSQPMMVKNHNEILRCFALIAVTCSDRLVNFVLEKLDTNNEAVKIGCLTILRHLINSSEAVISNKMASILVTLKGLLNETNNKVKKVFAHVIVALAHHGYLELDSNQAMTEFIIKQCALPDESQEKSSDPDYVSNSDLRSMCENILHLLTTTVEKMATVFWPHILEFIIPKHLLNAVGVVSKSATYLAKKMTNEGYYDLEVDFEKHKNLPRPIELIARLFVLLGHPFSGNNRGLQILGLLKVLVPSLERKLTSAWYSGIPKLLQFLEEKSSEWSQEDWESLVLEFLSSSIQEVDSQDWTETLGKTFADQIHLYVQHPDEKNFLLKCIGIVLKKTNNKLVVNDLLELIFKNINHSVASDREGCAVALGYCAATHMDTVLVKLDEIGRCELGKKSKFFSFIKDIKGEIEQEIWKSTVILSYGNVAICSPPALLTARIESPILRNAMPYFGSPKEPIVRKSLIRMTQMIAKSLHPSNLHEKYSFRSKDDMLKHMQSFILAERGAPLSSTTLAMAIDACKALVKLDPVQMRNDRLRLLQTCYESVYSVNEDAAIDLPIDDEHKVILQFTISSLEELLKELLLQDVSPNNLYSLFVSLEQWLMSGNVTERERALQSAVTITKCFLDNVTVVIPGANSFESHGAIIARLIPRCTDPSNIARKLSLEVIHIILKTIAKYNGVNVEHTDPEMEVLQKIKIQVMQGGPESLFTAVTELAKVLSTKLSNSQLRQFLDVLMEGLLDCEGHSSSGTCVVLNNVLKCKAGQLHKEMETLIQILHGKLCDITCVQTRKGTLQIITTLASFHLSSVVNSLLSYPLPYDSHICDWWKKLAMDSSLSANILEIFCEILISHAPYTEHPDPRNKKDIIRVATTKSLTVVSAFREMFSIAEIEKAAQQMFERIFTCLLTLVGCYIDVFPPNVIKESPKDSDGKTIVIHSSSIQPKFSPSRIAKDALTTFLICIKYDCIVEDISSLIDVLDDRNANPDVVAIFAKSLAKNYQHHLPGVVTYFNPKLSSAYDSERIVAVAFFAELINYHSHLNQTALEVLLNSMLGRLVDSSRIVRRLAIRGLSSIGKLDVEHLDSLEWFGVYKYSNTILSAMMSGLDDKDDPDGLITLEAVKGLSRALTDMEENHVQSALINIALRIQPCFEKTSAELRAAAFCLFGKLARFGNGPLQSAFYEQVHNNLVCLLLHLNDEDANVIKACKEALRSLGPCMKSELANEMLQMHLIIGSQLCFRDFIAEFSKILAVDFSDKVPFYVATCTNYFKSSWSNIRGSAATFVGCLLHSIPDDLSASFENQAVFGAITFLLKDSSPDVKMKAVEAISLLHKF